MPRVLLPLLALAAVAHAAPVPFRAAKNDPAAVLRSMDGMWRVVVHGGADAAENEASNQYVRIRAGRWSIGDNAADGTFRPSNDHPLVLDPKRAPAWIDWQSTDRPGDGLSYSGVYRRVDANTLHVVYASPGRRPRSVPPEPGDGTFMVLRRVSR